MKTIKAAGKRMVKQVEVFDVYQGEHVESGKKSIALSIVYQSEDHTLTDQEIQEVHQTVLARLKKDCQAVLRGWFPFVIQSWRLEEIRVFIFVKRSEKEVKEFLNDG